MDWLAIINGAMGAGAIGVIYKVLDYYFSRTKLKAEADVLSSEEKENITEAAGKAVGVLGVVLTELRTENQEYKKIIKEFSVQIEQQSKEIRELQSHRDERTRQIEELTENNEALLSQIAALRAQIAKDTSETRELLAKYQELKEFARQLLTFLEKKGIDVSELNGKIPESVSKWKYPKSGR